MDAVRDLTRQVLRPSPICRDLLVQMCVLAFALGMVAAGAVESVRDDQGGWSVLFGLILGLLAGQYGRSAWLWYQYLD